MTNSLPVIRQTVLDATDARALAEFYRLLLGLVYRPGDEPPPDGCHDPRGQDWLVLRTQDNRIRLAFQQVDRLPQATWPTGPRPQQLHLDLTVTTKAELDTQHQRAVDLGATLRQDRSANEREPLRVYTDPAGHPFCLFVAGSEHV